MASKIFQSLLARLNNVFSKDPRSIAAFQIQPPAQCKLVIADRLIQLIAVGNSSPFFSLSFNDPYDAAKSITIRDLYDMLGDNKIATVSNLNLALSGLTVSALVEGEFDLFTSTTNSIMASTSLLWSIFRPLAYVLEDAKGDVEVAIRQLGFITAQGDFLDYWGKIFNVSRYLNEPDYEYSIRLLWETVKPRLNNVAIENIIKQGVGYDARVIDFTNKILLTDGFSNPTHLDIDFLGEDSKMIADSELGNASFGSADDTTRYSLGERYTLGSFGVFTEVPISSPYYQYTNDQIIDIVNRHKAAGTTPWFIVTQVANEVLSLINSVVIQLEQSIDQQLTEDTVKFFGQGDLAFYTDHWAEDNVSKMPWYQNRLEVPSLTDNTVLATAKITIEPPTATDVSSYFIHSYLTDGFNGGFNANMAITDGSSSTDAFDGLIKVTTQFPIGDPTVKYVYNPIILNYQRVTDDAISTRTVETLSPDVMSKTTSAISGAVAAWAGSSPKTTNNPSDVTYTTPIQVIGPTSISGVHFDAALLEQQNVTNVPVVVRNLEIPNFGNNWQTGYPITRTFLVPYQDTCGNRYYQEIQWPISLPPPAVALRIANPTASITASSVQVATGGSVQICWTVTNSASAHIDTDTFGTTLPAFSNIFQGNVFQNGTSTHTSTVVTFAGCITYNGITANTTYTIFGIGNNGQISSASITVTVVAVPTSAMAPSITASAFPDKVTLCDARSSVINYSVDFQSKQTENRTIAWPGNAGSFVLTPIPTDPAGTIIIDSRIPTVSRTSDGLVINGGWTGYGTTSARFTPLDLSQVIGKNLLYNFDVNYAGSSLVFNGTSISLPNMGEVFQVSQQAVVDLPSAINQITQAPPLVNFIPVSDAALSTVTSSGTGQTATLLTDSTTPISGFTHSIHFAAGSTGVLRYTVPATIPKNSSFTFSLFIKRDDGGVVTTGLVFADVQTENGILGGGLFGSIVSVGGGVYRGVLTASSSTACSKIIVQVGQFGGAAFSITGWQFELNNSVSLYQSTPIIGSFSSLPTSYSPDYTITASNYAATYSLTVPIYVSTIQEGAGNLSITAVTPNSLVEAIGNTINESVPIVLSGTGFSSQMEVYLLQPSADGTVTQYVQAAITSLNWQTGSLTFIAPRFTEGQYPILVNNIDCLGRVVASDNTKVLVYNESTFRHPPHIVDINPKTICVIGGFTSSAVTVTGSNFRTGAVVYVLLPGGQHATTTRFINENALSFDMDVSTVGTYDIMIVNTDTSSGATNNQLLKVMSASTHPTIGQYAYKAPLGIAGCAQYGGNFTFYWSCTDASYVNFTSSDPKVQNTLVAPDINGWPAQGSVSVPVFTQNTTVTLTAKNECNNTTVQNVTVIEQPCDQIIGIITKPNPLVFTNRNPIAPTISAVHRVVIGVGVFSEYTQDISSDSNLKLSLVNNQGYPIARYSTVNDGLLVPTTTHARLDGNVITPLTNGWEQLQASWNGFVTLSDIFVQLPVPQSLTVTPDSIVFSNINQKFQLTVTATYSDGSQKSVTSSCKYFDYDPGVIKIDVNGSVTTVANGHTNVRVSYVDQTVDPAAYVYANVQIGPSDDCIGFDRLWTNPLYSIAAPPTTNVRWVVSGSNAQTANIPTDADGNSIFSYTGNAAGIDTIQAFLDQFGVSSNKSEIEWVDLTGNIGVTQVTGQFFFSDGSGVFNTPFGTIPAFTQSFNSLVFNISGPGYGIPFYINGDQTRPMFNVVLNNDASFSHFTNVGGNGYQAGTFPLKHFNAVFTGSFVVKQAGQFVIAIWGDDGYSFGLGGGAFRISGDYTNAPFSGIMPFTGVPVMGARNIDGKSGFSNITVSFPEPGLYPFEFNYSEGGGDHYAFIVVANPVGQTPLMIQPVDAQTLNALPQSSVNSPVDVRISPITIGPVFVGSSQALTGTVTGLTKTPSVLNIDAHNVRTAIVNGVSVLNSDILSTWSYRLPEILSAPKAYRVQLSNFNGSINATAFANVLTFSPVSIDSFSAYNASNNSSLSNSSINLAYGQPVGILWKTSNAKSVTITDNTSNITYNLAGLGSMYLVPQNSGTIVLKAIGVDGSKTTKTINIALNSQFSSSVSVQPQQIQIGQTSTLTPPAGMDSASAVAITDVAESMDGTIPTQKPPVNLTLNNNTFIATVSPIRNSIYHYQLTSSYTDCTTSQISDLPINDFYYINAGGSRGIQSNDGDCVVVSSTVDLYAAVNVDPGPSFTSLFASSNRINVGEQVTISYVVTDAVSITGDFVADSNLPLGSATFVVFPDRSTNYTFTAISATGISSTATLHIDVNSQQYSAPCTLLPFPTIDNIAIDGVTSQTNNIASMDESENIRVLEIFGNHFFGDRASTPELVGNIQVFVVPSDSNVMNPGIEIKEISSVSNTYIRAKIAAHAYTKPGNYNIALMNDVGVTTQRGSVVSFNINVRVPEFIMNTPITGNSGDQFDVFVDFVDPVRDTGLNFIVNGNNVAPTFIGSNLSDSDFVVGLYNQILGRNPVASESATWISNLEDGSFTRLAAMNYFLSSQEYRNRGIQAVVALGTRIRAAIVSNSSVGVGLRTDRGISDTQIQFVVTPPPAALTFVANNCPAITGIFPMQGNPGDIVTLTGTNLSNLCTVKLGTTPASSVFVNSNVMTFTVPSFASSTNTVVVVNNGSCTSTTQYFYVTVFPNNPITTRPIRLLPATQSDIGNVDSRIFENSTLGISRVSTNVIGDTLLGLDVSSDSMSNSGVTGSGILQPTASLSIQGGLQTTAPDTNIPVVGGYEAATSDSASLLNDSAATISTVPITTTVINNVAVSQPTTVRVAIIDHGDTSTKRLIS
jgi:hypothetical protein